MTAPCEIAIVDDEPIICDMVQAICSQSKLETHAFYSAHTLLASQDLSRYKTIFMDLSLPDMSGLDLISEIARITPTVHLVIVSGHSREVLIGAKWRAKAHGIASCQAITKPFVREDILRSVRTSASQPFS